MPNTINNQYSDITSKIQSYNTTLDVSLNNELTKKITSGDNFQKRKSEATKKLNDINSKLNRFEDDVKNQYDELIEIFKVASSIPSNIKSNLNNKKANLTNKINDKLDPNNVNTKYKSLDYLLRQILLAAQNTKSRIGEILTEEVIKTAGCSEEQTFTSENKLYIRVKQVDITKLLVNNPEEGNNSVLYENYFTSNGDIPFAMDRELFHRIQNEGVSFFDEYGSDYIGASQSGIMDIKYVTSYTDDGVLYEGDFLEVTLSNRLTGNNISDFIRDYYKSIDILEFDTLGSKIMNLFTNFADISVGLSTDDKREQKKFEKIIQRVLGLCFDDTKEIDVSGKSKISELDFLDDSFFETSPSELRNIEVELNNYSEGIIEFETCENVKFPVDTETITDNINQLGGLPPNQQVDNFIESIDRMSEDEKWQLLLPDGIDLNISIKEGILKIIPKAVVMTILSPKVLLGLVIALKAAGSAIVDLIEDIQTFIKNMRKFLVNLISKIGAIFVEEIFKLLKKNLRKLVELLIIEIVKESKNVQLKIITTIAYALIQIANAAIDWRQCKSVVDEILNLLNLGLSWMSPRVPTFALAASRILPGYSTTRALSNVVEGFQKIGIPTGDTPSGKSNKFVPAIFETLKGHHEEFVSNAKTEIFIPPLAVVALGGGTTKPGRGYGKTY